MMLTVGTLVRLNLLAFCLAVQAAPSLGNLDLSSETTISENANGGLECTSPHGFCHRKLQEADPKMEVIANEYIIQFDHQENEHPRETVTKILADCEEGEEKHIEVLHVYEFSMKNGAALAKVTDEDLQCILDHDHVNHAERDGVVYAFAVQDDIDHRFWGIDRIDQQHCLGCDETGDDIPDTTFHGLTNHYRYDWTGSGVQAYIIDSGVKSDHDEFSIYVKGGTVSRVVCGRNFRHDLNETCEDEWGHGTHVAGIVGGFQHGVAKKVQIVAIKVFGKNGSSRFADIIAGLEYVLEQKIRHPTQPMVVNLSLGTAHVAELLNNVTDQVVLGGVPVVVAAGNGGTDSCQFSPASAKLPITVGASGKDDQRLQMSNYGKCIDLYAPGGEISSAWVGKKTNIVKTLSGTSMATPFVTGIIALYLEQDPEAKPETIRKNLLAAATPGVFKSDENDSLEATVDNQGAKIHDTSPNLLVNAQFLFVSSAPSAVPSEIPTSSPSQVPSSTPSISSAPSNAPSDMPSEVPSSSPSDMPSSIPSRIPSSFPSEAPSEHPTTAPSEHPTEHPTTSPTKLPTSNPSNTPTPAPVMPTADWVKEKGSNASPVYSKESSGEVVPEKNRPVQGNDGGYQINGPVQGNGGTGQENGSQKGKVDGDNFLKPLKELYKAIHEWASGKTLRVDDRDNETSKDNGDT